MITVAVADDEEQICLYLRRILGSADGVEITGHALDGAEAVDLAVRTSPDVMLVDVRMPKVDGLSALTRLRTLPRPPAVVLLTNYNDDRVALRALRSGAAGVVLKSAAPADLVSLTRLAAAGYRIFGSDIHLPFGSGSAPDSRGSSHVLPAPVDDTGTAGAAVALTGRERDVLALLGEGLSNRGIAARLDLSPTTVKGHVSSLMEKLRCRSRLQLGLAVVTELARPGPDRHQPGLDR